MKDASSLESERYRRIDPWIPAGVQRLPPQNLVANRLKVTNVVLDQVSHNGENAFPAERRRLDLGN